MGGSTKTNSDQGKRNLLLGGTSTLPYLLNVGGTGSLFARLRESYILHFNALVFSNNVAVVAIRDVVQSCNFDRIGQKVN